MVAVLVVALASIGLLAWLVVALGGFALEARVPRPSVIARFAQHGVRRGGSAPRDAQAELDGEGKPDEPVDVEMAVRQRLYGSHARPR